MRPRSSPGSRCRTSPRGGAWSCGSRRCRDWRRRSFRGTSPAGRDATPAGSRGSCGGTEGPPRRCVACSSRSPCGAGDSRADVLVIPCCSSAGTSSHTYRSAPPLIRESRPSPPRSPRCSSSATLLSSVVPLPAPRRSPFPPRSRSGPTGGPGPSAGPASAAAGPRSPRSWS